MSKLLTFRRGLALGLTLGPVAAALAGCGSGKLTAQQAAEKLAPFVTAGSGIHCLPATDGWDYRCTVKPPHRVAFATEVDVNSERVTSVSGDSLRNPNGLPVDAPATDPVPGAPMPPTVAGTIGGLTRSPAPAHLIGVAALLAREQILTAA